MLVAEHGSEKIEVLVDDDVWLDITASRGKVESYQHGADALLSRPEKLQNYQVALADEAKVKEVI